MGSHILTIGALFLLGVFLLSANGLLADSSRLADENEYCLTSISIAQSIIDEAKAKSFDETTTTGNVPVATDLSPSLGPDASETIAATDTLSNGSFRSSSVFDDVDDYNGYHRQVSTSRVGGYDVRVSVNYASLTAPDSVSPTRTFCKRMVVTVTNPYMTGPIQLSYAFAY
jgi:hypothetical protein